MSSSKEIKQLIIQYNPHYENAVYAAYMASKSNGKKKQKFYEEADYEEEICYGIANQISKLNPSKYMIAKYPIIQDILESI